MFLLDLWTTTAALLVQVIWSTPIIVGFLLCGLYFSIRLGFLQLFKLPLAITLIFRKEKSTDGKELEGDISGFQALMTAMACTIGTGNIAGVSFAVAVAGPGAIFWMWVAAILGMILKYVECYLGSHYRVKDQNNEMAGGPMYYIENGFLEHYGINMKWYSAMFAMLAIPFACLCSVVHSNTISVNLIDVFNIEPWISAVVVFIMTIFVVIGGVSYISAVATYMVPFMGTLYMLSGCVVLFIKREVLTSVFYSIFEGAFFPESILGGVSGFFLMDVIQQGIRRGVFSSESGQGSATMASAAAKTTHPAIQAFIGMTGTFIDTIVCTMTGLILLCTGIWTKEGISDAVMVKQAFDLSVFPGFGLLVSIGLILFAYTSVLGMCYFGDRGVVYLLGSKFVIPYRIIYSLFAFIGPFIVFRDVVWNTADIFSGLMLITNVIALLFLAGKVVFPGTKQFLQKHT